MTNRPGRAQSCVEIHDMNHSHHEIPQICPFVNAQGIQERRHRVNDPWKLQWLLAVQFAHGNIREEAPSERSVEVAMAGYCSICSWFGKLLEKLLLLCFFFMSFNIILIDAQIVLPAYLFPKLLRGVMDWYVREYGDYLIKTKPPFLVGLVLVEIFVQWPLTIASIYGLLTGKSWARTTCLVYGVCTATTMAPLLADMYASEEASNEQLAIYISFLVFPLIAIGRGLVPLSSSKPSFAASSLKETKRA